MRFMNWAIKKSKQSVLEKEELVMKKMTRTLGKISLILLVFVLSGCGDKVMKGAKDSPVYKNPDISVDKRVQDLLGRMTLAEKIGQMTQAEQENLQPKSEVATYFIGSVFSGGNSEAPDISAEGWATLYDELQKEALKSRLGIPMIYGIDAVHGHNNVRGATIFPHNIGLGATRDPDLVKRTAEVTAEEIAGTGIDWNFAPCVAVPQNERWGRTYEGFAESPELVSELSAAYVDGLQGNGYDHPYNVVGSAKHYIGDGGTTDGIDQGNTEISEAELREIHLPGYITTINHNVGTIMVSYSSWNGEKLHGNKYLITELLKNELGYKGIAVSDYNAIDQLPGDYKEQISQSINAGIDMIMVPAKFKEFISLLTELVNEGAVPMSRIDDAVTRILRIKFEMGLFEHPYTDKSYTATVGSADHRAVARQAVKESIVLLKNDNDVLPLSKNLARIHVAGKNADDIGNQCGGWTISWQGESGNVTPGTSILDGIKEVASPGTEVTYSNDGTGAAGAEVGIVIIGEKPYAEFEGDRTSLVLDDEDIQAIQNVKGARIPIVVVLLSGRPMIITDQIGNWDAFLAAWLPGTEGAGVADVLFGDYNPTGKLPHTWPRSMAQIPINDGDGKTNPLYPYGFGLSY